MGGIETQLCVYITIMGIRDYRLLFSGEGWPQGDVRGFVCRRKVRLYSSVGLLHVSQDVWKGGEN
jgi:hypothetical protein